MTIQRFCYKLVLNVNAKFWSCVFLSSIAYEAEESDSEEEDDDEEMDEEIAPVMPAKKKQQKS